MILFPAIDLKEGQCVRLAQGDMARATVFNDDPAEQARAFERQGFEYLHVVDLDGAFAGAASQRQRGRGDSRGADDSGAARRRHSRHAHASPAGWKRASTRVIIGTAAVNDPALVREAARLYPGRIAVGIDAKDGMVAVEGWARTTRMSALDLGRSFEDAGVAAIIYTDIARDGILKGLNIEATLALADALDDPRHRLGRPRLARRRRAAAAARLRASSPAPSPAARSMTAGSIRRQALALIRGAGRSSRASA